MKKILVATDFSECAEHALQTAVSIVKKTGAELILLHVISRPLDENDDSYENYHNRPKGKTVVTNVQEQLESLLTRFKLCDTKIIYEIHPDVYTTILDQANRNQVDLILMGAYGENGGVDSFVGSTTEGVMLNAIVPVLVVKEKLEKLHVENIVFASEFYGDALHVFPQLLGIIQLFHCKMHLLKVNTPDHFQRTDESIRLMTEFSEIFDLAGSTKHIYNDLTIEDGILNFSKQIEADLIAITPDGVWRLAHIFNKNITSELMKKTVSMVLSMKPHPSISPN